MSQQKLILTAISLLALLLTTQSIVAQNSFQDQITGSWKMDIEKTREALTDADQLAEFNQLIDSGIVDLRISFKNDGDLTTEVVGVTKRKGTWKLTGTNDDDSYNIEIVNGDQTNKGVIKFIDESTIFVSPESGPRVIMVRMDADEMTNEDPSDQSYPFIGKWLNDQERSKVIMEADGISEQEIKTRLAAINGFRLSFKLDGSFTITAGRDTDLPISGNWVLSDDSDVEESEENARDASDDDVIKKSFQLDCTLSGNKERWKITILDGVAIQVQPNDDPPTVFVRVEGGDQKDTDSETDEDSSGRIMVPRSPLSDNVSKIK